MPTPSSRIWRTVVFAGAMLGTQLAGCGSAAQQQPTTVADPQPSEGELQAKRDADAKRAEAQRAADEQAAKDAETKRVADEQAARDAELLAKRQAEETARQEEAQRRSEELGRVRGTSGGGKRGRGFVLS